MDQIQRVLRKKDTQKIVASLLITFCLAVTLIHPAYAGSISVDQNDGGCVTGSGQADPYGVVYCVIQDAIDDALPGDTINVAAGTYDEQLLINTRVHLVGDGSSTIIRPSATPVTGHYDVEINASNSSIMSFVFDFNGGTGLVDGSRGGSMGQFTGIVISDLDGPDVTGVHLSGNTIYTAEEGTGIQTGKNANIGGLTLDYNTFYGDADGLGEGVYVNPLKATATYGVNIISNNFYGNLFSGVSIEASNVVVKKNIIYSDTAQGTYGIRFIDLAGGVTYNGVQIGGPNSTDANYIINFVNGIRVGTSSDVSSTLTATIQNNWIEDNDQGIWARFGADLTVTGNTFTTNPIQVMDAHGELVLGTVFGSNSFDLSAYASSGTAIFSSVQDAIDDSSASDTVSVGGGTYDDTINIDTLSDLTIQGMGDDQTFIKSSTTLAFDVGGYGSTRQAVVRVVDSTNIVLQNMTLDFDLVKGNNIYGLLYWDSSGTVQNNTLKNMGVPGGTYYEITSYFRGPGFTDAGRVGINVEGNTFVDTGRLGVLIHDYVHAQIYNNTFYKTVDDFGYAIEMGSASTGVISGNTIYGFDKAADSDGSSSAGIYIENAFTGSITTAITKDVLVQNNEIYDSQYGLHVGNEFDGFAGDVDIDLVLSNNNIHNNLEGGIVIADEDQEAGSSVTINATGNTFTDNGDYGYYVYTNGDGNITANLSGETISGHGAGFYVTDTAGGSSASTYAFSITGSTFQDNPIQVKRDIPLTDTELDIPATFAGNTFDLSAYASYGSAIYSSVQDTLDDAMDGDTITVGPGVYLEDLVIDQSLDGIYLEGAGSGSTTIKGVANEPKASWPLAVPNIEVLASNVTIHGFTFQGPDPEVGYYASGMVLGGDDFEVYNNAFEVPNADSIDEISQAIVTYSQENNPTGGDLGGVNIHDNTFTDFGAGSFGFEGIYINPTLTSYAGLTIMDNTFSGDVLRAITTERSNVAVTGNTIDTDLPLQTSPYDFDFAGAYQGINVVAPSDVTVTGNTVNGFWKQVNNSGGALTLSTVAASNTFDLSAYASSGGAIFSSVQDAIDDASVSDTVSVGAGTYMEDLVIPDGLSDLELAGAGSGSTTLKGVAMVDSGDWPLAAPNIEVLADGVSIHDFTIQGPDPVVGYYSSGMVIGGNDLEVYDNAFEVPNAASSDDISQGMQSYTGANNPTTGGIGGLYVQNNTFTDFGTGDWGYEGIYINSDVGDPAPVGLVEISGNTFGGDIVRALTTERSNVSILNNTIANDLAPSDLSVPGGWQGINVRSSAEQRDINVSDNVVGGSGAGLGFYEGIRIGQDENQVMDNITVGANSYTGENDVNIIRYYVGDRAGFYDPVTDIWRMKTDNQWDSPVEYLPWGPSGEDWIPVIGDWDADGVDEAGYYEPATKIWRMRTDNFWTASVEYLLWGSDSEDWIPVTGDWNADGIDEAGFYDPVTRVWKLKSANTWDASVQDVLWGPAGEDWIPIAGDWDGDGVDEIGFYDPLTQIWRMKTDNTESDPVEYLIWGDSGGAWTPVIGDWDNDGSDEVGLYDSSTKIWRLKSANTWDASVTYLMWGPDGGGWTPVVGDW